MIFKVMVDLSSFDLLPSTTITQKIFHFDSEVVADMNKPYNDRFDQMDIFYSLRNGYFLALTPPFTLL